MCHPYTDINYVCKMCLSILAVLAIKPFIYLNSNNTTNANDIS